MRAPSRPVGRGPVPVDGTPVRSSATTRHRDAAALRAEQSSRLHAELRQVTNLGAVAAGTAGSARGNGHDMFPRGAPGPWRACAPGDLTGDCPDARKRAKRQRTG
jgi:hypothetical protein